MALVCQVEWTGQESGRLFIQQVPTKLCSQALLPGFVVPSNNSPPSPLRCLVCST